MGQRNSKIYQENVRLLAIELFLTGQSASQIAIQLNVRVQTIYLWIRLFHAKGKKGLLAKPQNGNPKIFLKTPLEEIRKLLEGSPRYIGLEKDYWNGPTLVQALKKQWDIDIHPKYVYRWLNKNGLKDLLNRNPKPPSKASTSQTAPEIQKPE